TQASQSPSRLALTVLVVGLVSAGLLAVGVYALARQMDTLEGQVVERTAAHQRSREYFESLVENSPVAIVTWATSNLTVTGWNPAAEQLFGFTASEALGHELDKLITTESQRTQAISYSAAALRGEQVRSMTQRTRKDGSAVDVELLAVPVIIDGEPVETIVVYHDVTELLRAKEFFESLVKNSPVAIITWNAAGRTVG